MIQADASAVLALDVATAVLATGIALDGTATLALAAAGDATTAIPLDGSAALALTTAPADLTQIALDGTATLAAGSAGDLLTGHPAGTGRHAGGGRGGGHARHGHPARRRGGLILDTDDATLTIGAGLTGDVDAGPRRDGRPGIARGGPDG